MYTYKIGNCSEKRHKISETGSDCNTHLFLVTYVLMDCKVCNNRTKALLVFTFQCYIICIFPADGSLYCQSDSVWTNLNDYLGSIKLAIFVVLRHLGILNPLSAPLQDLSLKNIHNHPMSTPLHYPHGLPTPWRALARTLFQNMADPWKRTMPPKIGSKCNDGINFFIVVANLSDIY